MGFWRVRAVMDGGYPIISVFEIYVGDEVYTTKSVVFA